MRVPPAESWPGSAMEAPETILWDEENDLVDVWELCGSEGRATISYKVINTYAADGMLWCFVSRAFYVFGRRFPDVRLTVCTGLGIKNRKPYGNYFLFCWRLFHSSNQLRKEHRFRSCLNVRKPIIIEHLHFSYVPRLEKSKNCLGIISRTSTSRWRMTLNWSSWSSFHVHELPIMGSSEFGWGVVAVREDLLDTFFACIFAFAIASSQSHEVVEIYLLWWTWLASQLCAFVGERSRWKMFFLEKNGDTNWGGNSYLGEVATSLSRLVASRRRTPIVHCQFRK